jgi:predicted RNase H-like nuclease (RuvC/YqgF family)
MDITVQDVLKLLISTGLLGGGFLWWLNRPKQKREMAAILGETYSKMLEGQKEYIEQLDERIDRQEKLIIELEKHKEEYRSVIDQLKKDNEECKYKHELVQLEIKQLKNKNAFNKWARDKVYVLDDDPDDLNEFAHKFAGNYVLDYRGFLSISEFMKEVKIQKPEIVVIDYRLAAGKTAEDVLKDLGYEPEVFIMSGSGNYENRFIGKRVRFFLKDEHYIYKIAMAILKHLTDKN